MAVNPPQKLVPMAGNAGVYKSKLPVFQLLLRGFLAGAYIAIGAALATMCSTGVADSLGPGFKTMIAGRQNPQGVS